MQKQRKSRVKCISVFVVVVGQQERKRRNEEEGWERPQQQVGSPCFPKKDGAQKKTFTDDHLRDGNRTFIRTQTNE